MPKPVVVVASTNPVKKAAARDAYLQVFFPEVEKKSLFGSAAELVKKYFNPDEVRLIGAEVATSVHVQPRSEEEAYLGARNRLNAIRGEYPEADCWIAIEGGVIITSDAVQEIGCLLVFRKNIDKVFRVEAPRFEVPEKTAALIRDGWEMGPANDKIFGRENSKQAGGMAGIITDELVTRYDLYYTPLLIAFSQSKNHHLYRKE